MLLRYALQRLGHPAQERQRGARRGEPRRVLLRPFRRRHGGSGRDGKGRDFRLRSAGTAPRPDAVRIVVASLDVAMELSERSDRF